MGPVLLIPTHWAGPPRPGSHQLAQVFAVLQGISPVFLVASVVTTCEWMHVRGVLPLVEGHALLLREGSVYLHHFIPPISRIRPMVDVVRPNTTRNSRSAL